MQNSTLDVVVAGHLCLELIPHFLNPAGLKISEILRPGSLVNTAEMTIGTGGAVSNTGFALQIFGCNAAFIAKVGNDSIGAMTLDILRKYGPSDGVVIADGLSSSYTVSIAPVGIDRIFLHCPGANDEFTHQDVDYDLVGRARLFHLGYPTLMKRLFQNDGREAVLLLETAKQTGVTTSMDISLPDPNSAAGKADWNRIYRQLLPAVDIFMPSIEEAYYTLFPEKYLDRQAEFDGKEIIDRFTPDEYRVIAERILDMGCAMVALKSGHNGWYFRSAAAERLRKMGRATPSDISQWANTEVWCPAFAVTSVASAAGAGDNAIAAFLSALLRNYPLTQCLKLANCAGYMNLKSLDTLGGLPSWDELVNTSIDLTVADLIPVLNNDWQWREDEQIWHKPKPNTN
ncbi:MAG: PfkB family carbohydrate kinase [Desulfobacterales bacterium]